MAIETSSIKLLQPVNPTLPVLGSEVEAQEPKEELKGLFNTCNLSERGYIEFADISSALLENICTNINKTLTSKGLNPIKPSDIKDEESFRKAIEQYQKATGKPLGHGNGIKKYADGLLGKITFEEMFPGLMPSNSSMACLQSEELITRTKVDQSDKYGPRITSEEAESVSSDAFAKEMPITFLPIEVGQLISIDASQSPSIKIEAAVIIVMKDNIGIKELVDQFIKIAHLNLTKDEKDALIDWFQEYSGETTLSMNDKLLIPTNGQLSAVQSEKSKRIEEEALLKSLPAKGNLLNRKEIESEVEASLSLFPVKNGLAPLDKDFVMRQLLQESGNDSSAESRVGASGLMQIMPQTARDIANELLSNNYQLSEDEKSVLKAMVSAGDDTVKMLLKQYPKLNIKMGTYYLVQQYNKFGGHKNLALAAYNWGPHRVAQFIKQIGSEASANIAMEDIAKEIIRLGFDTAAIKRLCNANHIPEETGKYIARIRRKEFNLA